MGELFKALSPEERAKWDELNAQDKERFKKEQAAYEAKNDTKSDSGSDDSDDSDSDDSDED
jgi:hypothetical protein